MGMTQMGFESSVPASVVHVHPTEPPNQLQQEILFKCYFSLLSTSRRLLISASGDLWQEHSWQQQVGLHCHSARKHIFGI